MSYVALYRKFRPQTFEDVKGQDHIVKTLKNEIKTGRIGHAYLFTGTRGTGKTTVAKIMAKVVNCKNPIDGSPCNECESCKAINSGQTLNVVEIDAASNNGVSNIRDIIDEVKYAPTEGNYRVYIVDEVHMLSNGAFNALLKTLEEPPSYVIFILATTEVHKIPITILSRCQRYDFRRISIETISNRLIELTNKENVSIEQSAADYIAKVADGSMRDALSLLDQCIAFYPNETLDLEKTLNVLGAVDAKVYEDLFKAMTAGEINECIKIIDNLVDLGKELGQFVSEYIWHIRNILITQTVNGEENLINASAENFNAIREETALATREELIRYIKVLSKLSSDIKYSNQKRVITEICFIKLCTPQMDADKNLDNVNVRLDVIEKKVETLKTTGVRVAASYDDSVVTKNTESSVKSIEEKKKLADALPEDIKEVISRWNEILDKIGIPENLYLTNDRLTKTVSEKGELVLNFFDVIDEGFLTMNDNQRKINLENAISETIGKKVKIKLAVSDKEEVDEDLEELLQVINPELLKGEE